MNQSMYLEVGSLPCRYCDERFPPHELDAHIQAEHTEQWLKDSSEAMEKGIRFLLTGEWEDD